jgi:hypothetical protein
MEMSLPTRTRHRRHTSNVLDGVARKDPEVRNKLKFVEDLNYKMEGNEATEIQGRETKILGDTANEEKETKEAFKKKMRKMSSIVLQGGSL